MITKQKTLRVKRQALRSLYLKLLRQILPELDDAFV